MSATCPDCLTPFVLDPNEGMSDVRCDACEGARIMAEADAFRQPAPPPIPVRGGYWLAECGHCGWIGSSEQCLPNDEDVVCPVCCSGGCDDPPSEKDAEAHGEAVMQRIIAAEAKATAAEQEAYELKLAAAGGEDVPGSASLITAADVMRWREESVKRERAQDARFARLLIAFHDAIRRPLGVTPDSGAEFYDPRTADEAEARRAAQASPKAARTAWPAGCIKPGSCSRHRGCMYARSVEQCRHFGQDLTQAVEAATRDREWAAAEQQKGGSSAA